MDEPIETETLFQQKETETHYLSNPWFETDIYHIENTWFEVEFRK